MNAGTLSLQIPEDRIHEKLQQLSINDSPTIPKDDPEPMSSLLNMVKKATVGVGNFGCVHLVRNTKLNQLFAIKVMNKRDIVRQKQIEHVFNEKNVLLLVKSHPFVTQLHATFMDTRNVYLCMDFCHGGDLFRVIRDLLLPSTLHPVSISCSSVLQFSNIFYRHATFMDTRNVYLCMDFCHGGDLFRVIRDHGNLSHSVAAFYGGEVVLCFEFLHVRDIAFRDLKPENVLIAADGHIKLCDFGFAKEVKDRTWTLCGTPEYLPPEILLGEGHNKAVDWWSFGVLLYEMMAGYPPFPGSKPMDIYDKILDGLYSLPPFFSAPAKDIIRKLLCQSPATRLGNLVGGTEDVKKHDFFAGTDWKKLYDKEIQPPIIPTLTDEEDLKYIDFVEDGKKDLSKFELFERPEKLRGDPYGSFFKGWDVGPC